MRARRRFSVEEMRYKARSGRKIKNHYPVFCAALSLAILAVVCLLNCLAHRSTVAIAKPEPSYTQPVRPDSTTQVSQNYIDISEEKFLILVNWEHPIPGERPEDLVRLDSVFGDEVVLMNGEGSIQKDAAEAAREMFLDAQEEGIGLYKLTGAYRSVQYQEQLFQEKKNLYIDYGNDPYQNPVKVLPGNCSEHATGLALDILSVAYEEANGDYAETKEGKWLLEHAHEYGFILRYPKGKENITGVIYEPWHYRYVGKQAAKEIYEQGICLEEYLE